MGNRAHKFALDEWVTFSFFSHTLAGTTLSLVGLLCYPQISSWIEALKALPSNTLYQGFFFGLSSGSYYVVWTLPELLARAYFETKKHTRA